jgi:DNA-binding IclR family transcriptional regulator
MTTNWWDAIEASDVDACAFFVALTDSAGTCWIEPTELARRAGLGPARVEALVATHVASGLVRRHPSRPDFVAESGMAERLLSRLARPSRARVA